MARPRYRTNSLMKSVVKSFAGGEIAPELLGRLDLDKWQTALRFCENWIPMAHGPIRTRPGTVFVGEVRNSSQPVRLLPFQWSLEQTMVIAAGDGTMQFHTNASTQFNADQLIISSITVSIDGIVKVTTSSLHGALIDDQVMFFNVGGTLGQKINGRLFRVSGPTNYTFNLLEHNGLPLNGSGLTATISATSGFKKVYKIDSPYLGTDLSDLSHVQSSDVMTLTHGLYKTRELKRLNDLSWTLTETSFVPTIEAPTSQESGAAWEYAPSCTSTIGAANDNSTRSSYVVTSVTSRDEESEPSQTAVTEYCQILQIDVDQTPAAFNVLLSRVPGAKFAAGCSIKIGGLANTTASEVKLYNWLNGKEFEILSVIGNYIVIDAQVQPDNDYSVAYASGAYALSQTATVQLNYAGAKNRIAWDAVPGAAYYNVYKSTTTGGSFGYIGKTDGTTFSDNNITPTASRTAAAIIDAFSTPGDYPRTCTYYEQRRIFAGTLNNPQTVWMTKTGTESNLLSSVPGQDNDAIRFRMDSRDHNAIQHLVPMNDLIILTSAGEWRAYAPNGDPITTKSLVIRPQSFAGCSKVTPVVTSGAMIYVQFGGYSLRELAYSWESQSYKSTDLTAMVPHLVEQNSVVAMAFQRVPMPVLWCVMTDGTMMSCTYMPEHKVVAFARHRTDGDYESVTVVSENNEDAVYLVVKRIDKDGFAIRMVERMASLKQVEDPLNVYQVDCGLTLNSETPVSTVSGLWHLEGKTVSIYADGAVHPQRVVSNGSITLDAEYSKITVGLPFTCRAETMPLAYEIEDGGISNVKNVNTVSVRVKRTTGLMIGPNDESLIDSTLREYSLEPGSAPEMKTGIIQEALIPDWDADGSLLFIVTDPVQAMVMSVGFEAAIDE